MSLLYLANDIQFFLGFLLVLVILGICVRASAAFRVVMLISQTPLMPLQEIQIFETVILTEILSNLMNFYETAHP